MAVLSAHTIRTVLKPGDPGVHSSADVRDLVQKVRRQHPGGVATALIGVSTANGFKIVRAPNGIIAVLIGLLLPAVQKLTAARNNDLALIETALKPGGTLGFLMADGSVQDAKTGRKVIDCEGYTYMSHTTF
jgi:hypothetical protein